jgi:LacI family trehalose operon transcriptional repressor
LTAETSAWSAPPIPSPSAPASLQQQGRDALQLASVGSTPLMKFLHPEILTVDPAMPSPDAGPPGS